MPYDIVIGRNKEDKRRFKDKGLIFIGKGYVQMENYTSLSNKIWLDVARSHVILVAGKRGCLTGDTLILTNNGYKPIINFNEKNDKVFSFNKEEKKFELENAELLKYDILNNEKLLEIEFTDGKKIRLTKEHPLLTFINTNNLISLLYTNADKLKKEDEILSIKNSLDNLIPLKIKSIKEIDGIKKVYDLHVSKNHSFIANGIISSNSGKSYTIGVIAEELSDLPEDIKKNIAPLIFDTMGIFWTMKYKNEKEIPLLEEWELKTKNLPSTIWTPYGYFKEYEERGIPVDKKFALAASELDVEDWVSIFELNMIEPVSVLIQKIISELQEKGKFDIEDIIKKIKESEANEKVKESAVALFEAAKSWKVFAPGGVPGTKINELIEGGKTSILDLSVYPSTAVFNVRALIIGLISKKLFEERMMSRKKEEIDSIQYGLDTSDEKKETPLVWIFLDECLNGNAEIITDKAHTPMQEIVKKFENGEKFKVLGYDKQNNSYDYFDVLNVYNKGKRKTIKITTETGREIICTPEHRLLTENNVFASAFSLNKLAISLFQHYSKNPKIIEARILGHLFGDGWIYKKKKTLGFSGKGNKEDLQKIKKDLLDLGYKSTNVYERKTTSKINHQGKINIVNGISQSFTSTIAYDYFSKLANFSGKKTSSPIKIPEHIINASNLEKAEFLAALMGSDGQIISKAKNAKGDFNAIRFSFNKIESLEKEAFEYAEQIKKLFEDLGVKISRVSKKEGNLRKDGKKTIKIIITLEKNVENTIRFLEKIGYRYCFKKEIEGLKWLEYLKARLFLKNKREEIKQKALELNLQGLGKTKISKQLNFPEAQIRDWIYNKTSPGLPKTFLDFEEWISNREKDNILLEKIFKVENFGEEEVYDISVDKVHNFVANNIISHNCHEFLPMNKKTPATNSLLQLLREGRQPGISLVLATQQPGVIHRDVMTQSDVVISHRLTNKKDMEALNEIMQSYYFKSIQKSMNALPDLSGSALVLDDNSERLYPIRVRPRFTWHGGETPAAIKEKARF